MQVSILDSQLKGMFSKCTIYSKIGNYKKKDEANSFKSLIKEINSFRPHYKDLVKFSNIISSTMPGAPKFADMDVDKLFKYWKKLSDICHRQIRTTDADGFMSKERIERGFDLLKEVISYFESLESRSNAVGFIDPNTLYSEVRELFYKMIDGSLSSGEIRKRLILLEPVLEKRRRDGGC